MGPNLLFSVKNTSLSFRAALLEHKNPDTVRGVLEQLPLNSFLTNTVIAGETLQIGTKIVSLKGAHMVERELGGVYCYAPGAQINVCYGKVTETAKVNQFAQVYAEDLDDLRLVGKLVREQTMASANRKIVRISVSLIGGTTEPAIIKQPDVALPSDPNHWRVVKAEIEKSIENNWHDEPDEIRLIRLGVVQSGAGTGGSSYPILVHDKAYLMVDGGGILFRCLKLSTNENITVEVLKTITNSIFFETFDHFVFFGDLGLETLKNLGSRYKAALDSVHTTDEYVELSAPLLLIFNVFHRWINLIFPWHHGAEYPHCTFANIADASKLPTYGDDVAKA
ncbi:hypothetical protein LMH87_009532 [Akanthomyces muscarius]|nr:hypothetical protein LMH87_009532 [Akanthomyces muscarius]KAJ4153021.1 hypothetical protein LMH87_009532 [Akanthomyces muscarius]